MGTSKAAGWQGPTQGVSWRGLRPVVLRGLLQPCEVHSQGDSRVLLPLLPGAPLAGAATAPGEGRWEVPGEGRVEHPRADPVIGTSSGEPAGRGSQQRPSDQFLSPWLPCSCGGDEGQGERGLLG